jgi:hypothetical protein
MGKKVLRYIKPKKVTPERVSKMEQGFLLINEALGEDTAITDEEYKALPVIADKRKQECDDVFGIAKQNTEFVLEPVTIEDTQDFKEDYEFCDAVRIKYEAFKIRLEREQNISGGKYFNNCNVFEGDVDDKIKRGNSPKAQNVKAQLDNVNRKRGGNKSGDKKDDTSVAKKDDTSGDKTPANIPAK